MISDIVCEQLVKKNMNMMQILKIAGVGIGGLLLSILLYVIGWIADPAVGMMGAMFFICGMIATVFFIRFVIFVEYEYTFVNGELTVDRILARSSRKKMTEINVKMFEKLGKYDEETVTKLHAGAIRDYSSDKLDPATMFAFYKDPETGRNTVLLFTPNQKLIDAMKPYVSATVYREAFRDKK